MGAVCFERARTEHDRMPAALGAPYRVAGETLTLGIAFDAAGAEPRLPCRVAVRQGRQAALEPAKRGDLTDALGDPGEGGIASVFLGDVVDDARIGALERRFDGFCLG